MGKSLESDIEEKVILDSIRVYTELSAESEARCLIASPTQERAGRFGPGVGAVVASSQSGLSGLSCGCSLGEGMDRKLLPASVEVQSLPISAQTLGRVSHALVAT